MIKSLNQIGLLTKEIKQNHKIILASLYCNKVKDENNDLKSQIKKISQKVYGNLKCTPLPEYILLAQCII